MGAHPSLHAAVLAARGGETAQLAMLVHGVDDPVDAGVLYISHTRKAQTRQRRREWLLFNVSTLRLRVEDVASAVLRYVLLSWQ